MKKPKPEGEVMLVRFTVRIPEELLRRLKIRAAQDRTTLQAMVNALLEEHLKRKGGRP